MSEQDDLALVLKAAKWAVYQYDTPRGELGPAIARLESGGYVVVRRALITDCEDALSYYTEGEDMKRPELREPDLLAELRAILAGKGPK